MCNKCTCAIYTNQLLERWACPKCSEYKDYSRFLLEDFNIVDFLQDQAAFSEKTFGPGERLNGVLSHLRKELAEIDNNPKDLSEWIDVILLALDGARRQGFSFREIIETLMYKLAKNKLRKWPDWRNHGTDEPIEHMREFDNPNKDPNN